MNIFKRFSTGVDFKVSEILSIRVPNFCYVVITFVTWSFSTYIVFSTEGTSPINIFWACFFFFLLNGIGWLAATQESKSRYVCLECGDEVERSEFRVAQTVCDSCYHDLRLVYSGFYGDCFEDIDSFSVQEAILDAIADHARFGQEEATKRFVARCREIYFKEKDCLCGDVKFALREMVSA